MKRTLVLTTLVALCGLIGSGCDSYTLEPAPAAMGDAASTPTALTPGKAQKIRIGAEEGRCTLVNPGWVIGQSLFDILTPADCTFLLNNNKGIGKFWNTVANPTGKAIHADAYSCAGGKDTLPGDLCEGLLQVTTILGNRGPNDEISLFCFGPEPGVPALTLDWHGVLSANGKQTATCSFDV